MIKLTCNDLIFKYDDNGTNYQKLKLELDFKLNEDFSDAEIIITLTNTSEKIASIPKDFHAELFSIGLEVEYCWHIKSRFCLYIFLVFYFN